MHPYVQQFVQSFTGYARYLAHEVMNPHWGNYFYWLIGISAAVYALELLFPWRKDQPAIREDFWLDTFYMFFNFFLFGLVGYAALSDVVVRAFNDFLAHTFGIRNLVALQVGGWPRWAQAPALVCGTRFCAMERTPPAAPGSLAVGSTQSPPLGAPNGLCGPSALPLHGNGGL